VIFATAAAAAFAATTACHSDVSGRLGRPGDGDMPGAATTTSSAATAAATSQWRTRRVTALKSASPGAPLFRGALFMG